MIRRMMFVASSLILILGVRIASAQEPTAPAGGDAKSTAAPRGTDWQASGAQGAVAAGGREAVAAGLSILKDGGNAADAGAATILALSVTDARSFCFGGEVPILVYDAQHQGVTVIAGQGAAPRLATLDHFKGPGGIPAKGIEAAAVPAALDACLTLLDRFGTMTFAQVVAPARELLRNRPRPETWHADLGRTLETLVAAEALAQAQTAPNSGSARVADRSRGLRLVADAFYRGPIAQRIDAWSRKAEA